jgi:hypothetical protein
MSLLFSGIYTRVCIQGGDQEVCGQLHHVHKNIAQVPVLSQTNSPSLTCSAFSFEENYRFCFFILVFLLFPRKRTAVAFGRRDCLSHSRNSCIMHHPLSD